MGRCHNGDAGLCVEPCWFVGRYRCEETLHFLKSTSPSVFSPVEEFSNILSESGQNGKYTPGNECKKDKPLRTPLQRFPH